MLVIRLFRVGKLNQPFFKIVVTEKKHAARAGRFVEEVGFYNPLTKEKGIKADRVKYWLGVGAQASDTAYNLFVSEKIIDGAKKKINITKSKKEKPVEAPAKPIEKPIEQTPAEVKTEEPKEKVKPAAEVEKQEKVPAEIKAEEPKEEVKPAPEEVKTTEKPQKETPAEIIEPKTE